TRPRGRRPRVHPQALHPHERPRAPRRARADGRALAGGVRPYARAPAARRRHRAVARELRPGGVSHGAVVMRFRRRTRTHGRGGDRVARSRATPTGRYRPPPRGTTVDARGAARRAASPPRRGLHLRDRQRAPVNVLVVSNMLPSSVEPERSTFNWEQVRALAGLVPLIAGAPIRGTPPVPARRSWERLRDVPRCETVEGIEVHHPRYLVVPRRARPVQAWSYARRLDDIVGSLSARFPPHAIFATWAYPDLYA